MKAGIVKRKLAAVVSAVISISLFAPSSASADPTIGDTVTLIREGSPSNLSRFFDNTTLSEGWTVGPITSTTFIMTEEIQAFINPLLYSPLNFQFINGNSYSVFRLTNPEEDAYYYYWFSEALLKFGESSEARFGRSYQAWVWVYCINCILVSDENVSGKNVSKPKALILIPVPNFEQTFIMSNEARTVGDYRISGLDCVDEDNLTKVNSAFKKLRDAKKTDINLYKTTAKNTCFIHSLTTGSKDKIDADLLIELGLIEADYSKKMNIVNAIVKADTSRVETIDDVKALIKQEMKVIDDRKLFFENVKNKIRSR